LGSKIFSFKRHFPFYSLIVVKGLLVFSGNTTKRGSFLARLNWLGEAVLALSGCGCGCWHQWMEVVYLESERESFITDKKNPLDT